MMDVPLIDGSRLWFLLAAALAFAVPAGLLFIGAAGLRPERAWDGALGGLAAIGLGGLGYWAIGFGLQFGGIGLFYPQPELLGLVWEWSALPESWGSSWGMAGLAGWFLSGDAITPTAYMLFLAHLPWAATAALLPMLALRGRAPAIATLLLALIVSSILYPLAGNWVQGGGWLASLGRNLGMGHGLVDFAGAGTVFLVSAGISLAGLLVWLPRQPTQSLFDSELPPVHLPYLSVVGALFLLIGVLGWSWANPIHGLSLSDGDVLRGAVNGLLFACGGTLIPLLYTWFVIGESDPAMSARGLAAGVIAGLAAGPFLTPTASLIVGLLAGGSVPFVTFAIDRLARLRDRSGIVATAAVPALIGLMAVGIAADGQAGAGWQQTGIDSYLDVAGQGVSGLLVAPGFAFDFPGQLQAQVIGAVTLLLWGFLSGSLICVPLAALFHGVEESANLTATQATSVPLLAAQRQTDPVTNGARFGEERRTEQPPTIPPVDPPVRRS